MYRDGHVLLLCLKNRLLLGGFIVYTHKALIYVFLDLDDGNKILDYLPRLHYTTKFTITYL